ncbi:MAG: hypothetical protein GY856_54845 [bacterium]|nr:hypothetical protein [bacterium]
MKFRSSYVLYGVVAIAVAAWALSLLGSDARRIRRRLAEFEELIEKNGQENNLVAANKARLLGGFFTKTFEIDIVPFSQVVTDRQQLMRVAMGYRSRSQRIGVAFREQDLSIDDQRRSADMGLVAELTGRTVSLAPERYQLRMQWSEEEGEWRIRRLEVIEGP